MRDTWDSEAAFARAFVLVCPTAWDSWSEAPAMILRIDVRKCIAGCEPAKGSHTLDMLSVIAFPIMDDKTPVKDCQPVLLKHRVDS